MKKINLLVIGLIAAFGFSSSVFAADSVSMTCDKKNISIGESASCKVTLNLESTVMATSITLDQSETLDVENVVPNTGWTQSASTKAGTYSFNYPTPGINGKTQVFSFDVKLNEKAANLSSTDDCGQLCIKTVTLDGGSMTGITKGEGTCFTPVLVPDEPCVGENCNPKTGAFANVAAIVGVAFVALGAIVIAKRSSKFYRI